MVWLLIVAHACTSSGSHEASCDAAAPALAFSLSHQPREPYKGPGRAVSVRMQGESPARMQGESPGRIRLSRRLTLAAICAWVVDGKKSAAFDFSRCGGEMRLFVWYEASAKAL